MIYHDGVCDVFTNDSDHGCKGEGPQQPQYIHDMRCQNIRFSDDCHPCIGCSSLSADLHTCNRHLLPAFSCRLGAAQIIRAVASSTRGDSTYQHSSSWRMQTQLFARVVHLSKPILKFSCVGICICSGDTAILLACDHIEHKLMTY